VRDMTQQTVKAAIVAASVGLASISATPIPAIEQEKPSSGAAGATRVVLLGTGVPGWDPDSSGPATAIIVRDTPYLVDFGPGVVRRAGAAYAKGVKALYPPNISVAFLTHRHVDHTVGFADLIFSPAQSRGNRPQALEVFGPTGTVEMTEHILRAHRLNAEDERYKVNPHDIKPGVVYKDANVIVTAFLVKHGKVEAYGYRFDTPDRRIVISGDTTPAQSVIDNCDGCDVLIHEAYSMATFNAVPEQAQAQRKTNHTSTTELAELATQARPKLLVIYHRSNLGGGGVSNDDDQLLAELQGLYKGRVVLGRDLDIH
jgi:ribonuclease BN (tRNA processing enzyme)